MKTIKIIFISLFLFTKIVTTYGQQEYFPTKNLDAFVGTWEYKTATETFQIVFIKGLRNTPTAKSDCVIGDYMYIKNGVTISNFNQSIPTEYNKRNRDAIVIFGTNANENVSRINPNSIRFTFLDKKLNKTTSGFYIRTNNFTLQSPTKARFQLFEDEGEYDDDNPMPPEGFSVPTDVVMKKIK